VGDRVPFVIIKGKSSRKNKTLFVDRAEDPAFVLENNMPLDTALFVDRAEDPAFVLENNMPLDTEYYENKQILPPVLRIFESFGVTKDQLCAGRAQSNLFSSEGVAQKAQKQKLLFDF
jgi:DNA polymerase I